MGTSPKSRIAAALQSAQKQMRHHCEKLSSWREGVPPGEGGTGPSLQTNQLSFKTLHGGRGDA